MSPLLTKKDFAPDQINGYFAKSIGANGRAFFASNIFLVADTTSVNDYRTTAHEIGHLFGLQHVPDENRLMAMGKNGEVLIDQEITEVRNFATISRTPRTCGVAPL